MKAGSCIYKAILLVPLLFFPLTALPQAASSCAENLKTAQSLFEKGLVERVPDTLAGCMKSGFKREEQLAAYKLIIQSYLLNDKLSEADSAMLNFLRRYPEYQLSSTDHPGFVYLYNNFNVKPVLQLALHVGLNLPFFTFVESGSVSGMPLPKDYTKSPALFASLEVKYAIDKKLEVNVEPGFSQLSFSTKEIFLDFASVNYSETQTRLEIPVTVTYNLLTYGKLTGFVRAGAGPAFTLAANTGKVTEDDTGLINFQGQTASDIDRMDSRIKMDLFGQAGAGVKFKTPRGFISFEARGNFGLYNQVLRNGASAGTLVTYGYKDDDFNMNIINFSLGYTQIFYKPSKENSRK